MSTELKPNNTGLLAEKRQGEIQTVPPLDKQGNPPTWPEDLEKTISTASPPTSPTKHDKRPKKSCIEYAPVDDDPRQWSTAKKTMVLTMVALGALTPTLGSSIYNPAFNQIRSELGATETQLSLSISLYILVQGGFPIFWSTIAEITGRKIIYLISMAIYITGATVASRAQSMVLLILMRLVQGFGSAAVLAIGAGSLADMYETHERGSKMGIYYAVPLVGPALGSVIGGVLTNAFSWRATFYLLACFGAVNFISFVFCPDSWRKERSKLYQSATQRALKRALDKAHLVERKRAKQQAKAIKKNSLFSEATSGVQTPATAWSPRSPFSPRSPESGIIGGGANTPWIPYRFSAASDGDRTAVNSPLAFGHRELELSPQETRQVRVDLDQMDVSVKPRKLSLPQWFPWKKEQELEQQHEKVKLSLSDVNPFPPMWAIIKKPANLMSVTCSGLFFAAQYTVPFTAAVTFAVDPYHYSPLKVGLILLSFGGGNILGSILGGKYSDLLLQKMKAKEGKMTPEMRLKSTFAAMPIVVAAFLTYAWTAHYTTHLAGPIISLFVGGFMLMVVYASALAHLVDINPGNSSTAVSVNSLFRGVMAFVASQVALPIRDAIGDGGLYTIFAGILLAACGGFILLTIYGERWRDPNWRWTKKPRDEPVE